MFTVIFALEAILKIIALAPKNYFSQKWNVFDIIVVILSLIDLALEDAKGLLVLRSFRLVL